MTAPQKGGEIPRAAISITANFTLNQFRAAISTGRGENQRGLPAEKEAEQKPIRKELREERDRGAPG